MSSDEKKDLTNILEYSETLKKLGQTDQVSEKGVILEETPIEKIDEFETLEQYASSNPLPEAQPETPPPSSSIESTSEETVDSQITPSSHLDFSSHPESSDFNNSSNRLDLPAPADTSPPVSEFVETPSEIPGFNLDGLNLPPGTQEEPNEQLNSEIKNPDSAKISADITPLPSATPPHPLDAVKKFAEEVLVPKTAVPAVFPFSLLITGKLSAEEKEKLLGLVSKENMGIRELDLEPQFENDRVLIPRISEYAGVLLVQALRGTQAQMKLGPSESIYISHEIEGEVKTENQAFLAQQNKVTHYSDISHPAEDLPMTTESQIPGIQQNEQIVLVDMISASAILKSNSVEAESSSEFQEMVEALSREVKYKAYRKGAAAITQFKIQITQLSSPTHYRLLATGSAVKINPIAREN